MNIDKKLWDDMRHTLSGISMPLVSHQQVQNLLNHVEQQSTQQDSLVGHDIKSTANGVDRDVAR